MSKPIEKPWVSAGKTRNFMLKDPLLDWLKAHGEAKGFVPDNKLPGYDPQTDFAPFIMKKGQDFEAKLYEVLKADLNLVMLDLDWDASVEARAAVTLSAIRRGPEAIAQGCVADPRTKTYGYPDLLIRSDVLARLWPDALAEDEARKAAPQLNGSFHYVVVDIKFTSLKLKADGTVGNDGSAPAYKAQLFVYNRALGAMQGYEPTTAFLMGRSWSQGSGAKKERGASALEKLGPVPMHAVPKKGPTLEEHVDGAIAWYRRVLNEGVSWGALPEPTVPELRPNMGQIQDAPWHAAKKEIAEETGELTLLWQVGVDKRNAALDAGLSTWRDVQLASEVGVKGAKTGPVLDALLGIHGDEEGPAVRPRRIEAAAAEWAHEPELEFYVDFETVSDLDDDFSQLPQRGGQPLIFMIGCGHVENGAWTFHEFTVDALTEASEATAIEAWLEHMASVRERLAPESEPKLIHWSHAEVSTLETAYNSAVARHPTRAWPSLNWFDFLKQVIKAEPVVVRGALGFGLKAIAKAFHAHGFIETCWGDGPTDGLGAMVGAWRAAAEARERNEPLHAMPLVREIAAYNEVDTRVMWEIVRHLRAHHGPGTHQDLSKAA